MIRMKRKKMALCFLHFCGLVPGDQQQGHDEMLQEVLSEQPLRSSQSIGLVYSKLLATPNEMTWFTYGSPVCPGPGLS